MYSDLTARDPWDTPPDLDQQEPLVEIDWDGHQPRWVRLARDWRKRTDPQSLVWAVLEQVNENCPPDPSAWMDNVTLSSIGIEELDTFNELIEAALEEDDKHPKEHDRTEGHHWSALWSTGRLLDLQLDLEWVETATDQQLCETLTDAVERPPVDDSPRPARDRFIKYMGDI